MSKKLINQNSNYNLEFLEAVESNFTFEEKPINRLKTDTVSPKTENTEKNIDKKKLLNDLKIEISTIEECELKNNSILDLLKIENLVLMKSKDILYFFKNI